MAYIHPENQKLLWNTIQKTPIFKNLGSQQSQWFKSVIQHFYEEYPNAKIIKNKDELQSINRATISYMVNNLKELVQPIQPVSQYNETTRENELPSNTGSNERMAFYNDQFNNRQKEYESMNTKPLPPTNNIVDEKISDEAITNMDELIRHQIEQRELELKMYAQAPLSQKITINEDIPSVEPTILLQNFSFETPTLGGDLSGNGDTFEMRNGIKNDDNKEKMKKNVSWKNEYVEHAEFEELKKMVVDLMETIEGMKQRLNELTSLKTNTIENI
jgi:hypothetical protein